MTQLAESTGVAEMIEPMTVDSIDQRELAEQLVEQAKEQNIELVDPDGLLGQLTTNVLETALDAEVSEHLGYEKHDPAGPGSGNSRNGTRAKTVLTEIGPVDTEWLNRPLEKVYPVIFTCAMVVKVRDGQVANKPVYVVIGVTVDGERDILGLWAGDGGEGAKFWLSVFTEVKNRGVQNVCIAVCDGLKGLPEAITTTWELATVQACVIHLIRNTFRFASRAYWDEMSRDLRPVYTAPSEAAARERFAEFDAKWGGQYPAVSKLWENAWEEFIPFLDYDVEIRRVICSTNAIESINARYRRAVRARGTSPTTQPR